MNTMGEYITLHSDHRYHLLLMINPLFTGECRTDWYRG